MNWDAIGAIGQVLGSIAVFVSLVYLAVQIRRSTTQARADAFVKLNGMAQDFTLRLASDLNLARTLIAANGDWNSLPSEGQFQAHMLNLAEAQMYECWYQMMSHGQIDEGTYESRENYIAARFMAPGGRYWWNHHNYLLDPKFIARINARATSVAELEPVPFFDPATWNSAQEGAR